MPLYEYRCTSCESRFELLRPMSMADETAPCPGCAEPARRAVSIFASFTVGANGEALPMAGGGCACANGGECACAN